MPTLYGMILAQCNYRAKLSVLLRGGGLIKINTEDCGGMHPIQPYSCISLSLGKMDTYKRIKQKATPMDGFYSL
jgi:hypothetical protein